ncbi:MAG TPA: putative capsular polysaccharide synthesis family protein [Candidatus Eisenbacteria bacterium]|nr:putative capsular polysaccharide synthesis family protein [Candidatus Eisenbacteria bacterium]
MTVLDNIRERLSTFSHAIGRRAGKIRRRLDVAPPVLIYQMGKVGSSSIYRSLKPIWPGLTMHTHFITRDAKKSQTAHIIYERAIRPGRPIFVISPVREPIARNVSTFFQNFECETGIKYQNSTFSVNDLIQFFLRQFKHYDALRWFDNRFRVELGLDVYDYAFPASGSAVISHQNIKLLLMRSELPDEVKENAIRNFLELPHFVLSNTNSSAEKDYSEMYRQFKHTFVPPKWYFEAMYGSRFFNHFYDAVQRAMFIAHWTQQEPAQSNVGFSE